MEVRHTEYTYTKEDFATAEPYRELLSITSPFERQMAQQQMADYAKSIGVGGFQKLFAAYCKSLKKDQNTIYIDSVTNFTGQTLELQTGDWRADDTGIYRDGPYGTEEMACSHPIMPVERLTNIDTGAEKLRIAFSRGRRWRTITVDKVMVASANKIVELAGKSIGVTSENARALVRYLSDMESINYDRIPERLSVGRLGYIGEEGFSPYVDGLVFDGDESYGNLFRAIHSQGNRDEWIAMATECRHMSLAARIVLAASFASVLISPTGCLPFFVHMWGVDSGTGKTVALMMAASVFGNPEMGRYIQTFNATAVSQEKTAAFLNSLPMLIDELQMAKGRDGKPQFNVYMLSAGSGKGRGNKTGGIDATPTWRNCFLTTGESPLTTSSDGAGAVNRVIDIECRADECVIKDGMRVSGTFKKNYGFIGREFVEKIMAPGNMDKIIARYQELFKTLSDGDTTEKQAMPAALILAADELITDWFFRDGPALTTSDIAGFLKTKASVSAGDRGYRYMCDWVAQNSNKLGAAESGDVYGVVEKDVAYIIKKVFMEAAESGGFSPAALLSYMKQKDLILTRGRNRTRGKQINGILTECVALKLTVPDDIMDDETDETDLIL